MSDNDNALKLQEIISLYKYYLSAIENIKKLEINCKNCQYREQSIYLNPCFSCSECDRFLPTEDWKIQYPEVEVSE